MLLELCHFLKLYHCLLFLGEGFASHWVPYWKKCSPCLLNYDMIGKLETGNDDFTVIKLTYLSSIAQYFEWQLDKKFPTAL